VLPFTIAAVLVVAVVVFVRHQTDDVSQIAGVNNPSALVEQNREDAIIVRQQQAPHVYKLTAGLSPRAGARLAVLHYMTGQIGHGVMDGPIKSAGCRRRPKQTSSLVLTCDVVASVVTYPFDAVVSPSAGTVTYCQVVAPPVPSMNIPVSSRCT
jgi:hypothetical protein